MVTRYDAAVRDNPRAARRAPAVPASAGLVPGGPEPGLRHGWLAGVLPPPPARILDAGCGGGALSAWLARLGYRVTAIDADAAAVAAARSAGVPAIRADLASYDDEPFDAVVMLLALHHMHPLDAVLGRVARLVRPGGLLALDEFAWDRADHATIRWFYDTAAVLAAAGVNDPQASAANPPRGDGLPGRDNLTRRWRLQHVADGTACNTGNAMIEAVRARFCQVKIEPVPYLARHLADPSAHPEVFAELDRIEREHLADGTLSATGFHLTARKDRT